MEREMLSDERRFNANKALLGRYFDIFTRIDIGLTLKAFRIIFPFSMNGEICWLCHG